MSGDMNDRRTLARFPRAGAIEVLVDEISFPAVLSDVSIAGLQARVDPVTFDEIRERIEAVRFNDCQPIPVTLEWGFFDGTFGASFKDLIMAAPIIESYLATSD